MITSIPSIFNTLPFPLITQISSFLKIRDINRIASTSKTFYNALFINVKSFQKTQIITGFFQQDALYWQINISNKLNMFQCEQQLKMIKYIFYTKDEGWIGSQELTSCIQAELFEEQDMNKQIDGNEKRLKIRRQNLIRNYESSHYIPKVFYLNKDYLKNVNMMRIYLKVNVNSWEIFCKKCLVRLIYGNKELIVNEKQLRQKMNQNRKKSIILY